MKVQCVYSSIYDTDYKSFAFGWFNDRIVAHDDCYTLSLDSDYFDGNWCIYDEKMSIEICKNIVNRYADEFHKLLRAMETR